ncbi:hypothetical protein [Aeromonas phage Asp37]|nr:hypothetical protein [Aeromonas phage Asp37]
MRIIIITLIIIAAMCMMAGFALAAEGQVIWSLVGAGIGFTSFRLAGWFEYHHGED